MRHQRLQRPLLCNAGCDRLSRKWTPPFATTALTRRRVQQLVPLLLISAGYARPRHGVWRPQRLPGRVPLPATVRLVEHTATAAGVLAVCRRRRLMTWLPQRLTHRRHARPIVRSRIWGEVKGEQMDVTQLLQSPQLTCEIEAFNSSFGRGDAPVLPSNRTTSATWHVAYQVCMRHSDGDSFTMIMVMPAPECDLANGTCKPS